MRFVVRLERGERMADLCREFGISRKTGYKVWNRYQQRGERALDDESRAPKRRPHTTPEAAVNALLRLKQEFPTWGSKKLRDELPRVEPGIHIPARSTIDELLRRNGLVKTRVRKRRCPRYSLRLTQANASNEVWAADFKGQFRLTNRSYCYPLTITDQYSRFLVGCEALENTGGHDAREVFDAVFEEHGLPDVIRTDNGAPFASTGLAGLTRLSTYWLRLGIRVERIEPGRPDQNGRHERFHLTLKQDTTRPAASSFLAQQERFDRFRDVYNQRRPHEALGMQRPAELYEPSRRSLPRRLPEPTYELHDDVLTVYRNGKLRILESRKALYLAEALAGERVGIRQLSTDRWLVSFASLDLGVANLASGKFLPNLSLFALPSSGETAF